MTLECPYRRLCGRWVSDRAVFVLGVENAYRGNPHALQGATEAFRRAEQGWGMIEGGPWTD